MWKTRALPGGLEPVCAQSELLCVSISIIYIENKCSLMKV